MSCFYTHLIPELRIFDKEFKFAGHCLHILRRNEETRFVIHQRIPDAAGRVAKALDQCVQGQNRLIGYLRDAALYDPKDLDAYSTSVQQLCQQATDANTGLQGELSR